MKSAHLEGEPSIDGWITAHDKNINIEESIRLASLVPAGSRAPMRELSQAGVNGWCQMPRTVLLCIISSHASLGRSCHCNAPPRKKNPER